MVTFFTKVMWYAEIMRNFR